jgi:hypothetical protein
MTKNDTHPKSRELGKSLLIVTAILVIVGLLGIFLHRFYYGEFFLYEEIFIEILIVSIVVVVSYLAIPVLFPKRVRAEDIFTGGYAAPPYISDEELLSPRKKPEEN